MIKLLDGLNEIGEEVKCSNCNAIIHVGNQDWKRCSYYVHYDNNIRHNDFVDCPKCYCTVLRFEDR